MNATRWPLAPQQEYMLANLAFQTIDPAVRFRNPFLALRMTGAFDIERFTEAVGILVAGHDVLRAELDATAKTSMRLVDRLDGDHIDVELHCDDPDAVLSEQEWHVFDPTRAPLWRVRVLGVGPRTYIVTFAFCHLIWDGLSMRTLLELLSREYTEPGSTGPPDQYRLFSTAAAGERARRSSRAPDIGRSRLLDAIADRIRQRRARATETVHLDIRRIPFAIGRETMDHCRRGAAAAGTTPYFALLRAYLTAVRAATDHAMLVAAFATSRPDLRPGADCLGYVSDLSLMVSGGPFGVDVPDVVEPALSWAELVAAVGPLTHPQEVWDVWARGPVFGETTDWGGLFPGATTAVLPLTPGWRMPVTDPHQRRVLGGHTVPSLIVGDLRNGTGHLEFNASAVSRRAARALADELPVRVQEAWRI